MAIRSRSAIDRGFQHHVVIRVRTQLGASAIIHGHWHAQRSEFIQYFAITEGPSIPIMRRIVGRVSTASYSSGSVVDIGRVTFPSRISINNWRDAPVEAALGCDQHIRAQHDADHR